MQSVHEMVPASSQTVITCTNRPPSRLWFRSSSLILSAQTVTASWCSGDSGVLDSDWLMDVCWVEPCHSSLLNWQVSWRRSSTGDNWCFCCSSEPPCRQNQHHRCSSSGPGSPAMTMSVVATDPPHTKCPGPPINQHLNPKGAPPCGVTAPGPPPDRLLPAGRRSLSSGCRAVGIVG